jgi:aspartate beta-hydroxylase
LDAASTITEQDARALANAIEQVSAGAPAEQAGKLVEMALSRAPDHPVVLNAVGGHYFRRGDARRARESFDRALAGDESSKVIWLNLATACRALEDTAAESQALERALALDPRYLLALLHKGELMERLGKAKAAALIYGAALASVPPGAAPGPGIERALQHAESVVRAHGAMIESFIESAVSRTRERHAGSDLSRFNTCLASYVGRRRIYAPDPKLLHVPFLPAIEFFRREDFPWLDALEAATPAIAAEAERLLNGDRSGFVPYIAYPPGTPVDQWAELNHSSNWSVYSLWKNGEPVEAHIAQCPDTAAAIDGLPLCDIPGVAPGVYFSVLKPGARIPPHTGVTNARSIVHLPLIIPEGCGFRVGGEVRPWERGKAWVFDDTIEHEAWNPSRETRVIMIFDIWNPLLSGAERDMLKGLVQSIDAYYGKDSSPFSQPG